MAVEVIAKIKPKNNGSFALIEACDVLVSVDENGNENRLDKVLEETKVPDTIEANKVKFEDGRTLPEVAEELKTPDEIDSSKVRISETAMLDETLKNLSLGGVQVDNESITMDEKGVLHASKYALAVSNTVKQGVEYISAIVLIKKPLSSEPYLTLLLLVVGVLIMKHNSLFFILR